MKIIGGEFGGRRLKVPRDSRVRPSGERIRAAWFSILLPRLPGTAVVDLFAGSGALGLEALSRGATRADFVERGAASVRALRQNIAALGVEDRARVHKEDAMRFIERVDPAVYAIAFADPPYDSDYAARLIERFRHEPFAAVFGVEHRAAEPLAGDESRRYGDAALTLCYKS